MSENFDVVTIVRAAAQRFLNSLSQTWTQILQWDNRKRGVSPTFLFFSPSFILVCFTIISHCSTYSHNFSFVIFSILLLHAVLKLTHNPISTCLHYQFLYSCVLTLFVLYYSPALPHNEVRILLGVLFPVYYHTLTSSISITLFLSFPVFLFILFSSFYDSLQNTTLTAALIVIPTIFWTKAREIEHNASNAAIKAPDLLKPESDGRNDLEIKDKLYFPDLSEKETTSEKEPSPARIVSDTATDENEKVILGISHDCRNLLNSLKVILTVMKDDICHSTDSSATQDDNLQSAIAITEHLALLLTNLLDYLKGKNQDANTQEEMKLTTTLEKIWLMISPNLKRKFLGGSITIKNGTPLVLNLDERKFMGVLLNIIGNAMKFTDTGHIKINVNWKETSADGQESSFGVHDARANLPVPGVMLKKPGFSPAGASDQGADREETLMSDQTNAVFSKTTFFDLRDIDSISFSKKCFTVMTEASHTSERSANGTLVVTVRDTGCGIDEESLKKLFKKYGQVGEDQEKNKLGLGLGLWYTKYLLGKLNGKIDFRSTKNVGTWVKIEIPCKIAHQRREVKQMINPAIPVPEKKAGGSNKMYVFVRENDNLASLLIGEYLKKRLGKGVDIHEIKSVYDILASEKFRSGTSVLVLGKNSVTRQEAQGLRALNRMQKDGERVPAILIREAEDVIGSADQAWDDVDVQYTVKKPIKQPQLDEIVRYVNKSFEKVLVRETVIVPKDEVPHVLIVDDENTSVMFLQKYLKKSGLSCLVARDGYEAVQIYQTRWPDIKLVLMDSEMPRMNGLDATRAIRRMGKDGDLKIIGLTGDDSECFKRRAKEIGMNDVILKPVPAEKLLQIVNNCLEAKAY